MSAGGQRSLDLSGITSMRLRETSDFVAQIRVRDMYLMFSSTTANAVRPRIRNGNDYLLQFLQGTKESCATCVGLPYSPNPGSNASTLYYRN
jgi:hypothetical protein